MRNDQTNKYMGIAAIARVHQRGASLILAQSDYWCRVRIPGLISLSPMSTRVLVSFWTSGTSLLDGRKRSVLEAKDGM